MLSNLNKRIQTGITFLFLSTYFILKNEILFNIYIILLSLFCFWEFLSIINCNKDIKIIIIYINIISLIIELYYKIIGKNIIISLILFPIIILLYYINLLSKDKFINFNKLCQIFFGWIYIGIPFFILRYIYHLDKSRNIIIGFIILLWINDNIYYYLINNNKIYNFFDKKIEILLSNIIYSLIIGIIFYLISNYNYDWIIISLLIPLLIPISNIIYKEIIINNNLKYCNNFLPGYSCFLDFFKNFIFILTIILGIFFI